MRPTVNAALGVALLATIGGASPVVPRARAPKPIAHAAPRGSEAELSAVCPPRTIPDGVACVPLPASGGSSPELQEKRAAHHDRSGELVTYDQIPRRPDRPEAWDRYRFPIDVGGSAVVSGYDLERPDDEQRRGPGLRAVGHGGVDLVAKRGTPVRSISLEGEAAANGAATHAIVYAGPLFGSTVVVAHAVTEGDRQRTYLVVYGHLDRIADGVTNGATIPEGGVLGAVGDTGSEGLVHLHLEVRRVRDGVDPSALPPGKLVANDKTVAVDPRNVLPLR